MPDMGGIEVLEGIKAKCPSLPVVILTAYASTPSAIEALNKGAYQYLEKKAKNDEIALVVKNADHDREEKAAEAAILEGMPSHYAEAVSGPANLEDRRSTAHGSTAEVVLKPGPAAPR